MFKSCLKVVNWLFNKNLNCLKKFKFVALLLKESLTYIQIMNLICTTKITFSNLFFKTFNHYEQLLITITKLNIYNYYI